MKMTSIEHFYATKFCKLHKGISLNNVKYTTEEQKSHQRLLIYVCSSWCALNIANSFLVSKYIKCNNTVCLDYTFTLQD